MLRSRQGSGGSRTASGVRALVSGALATALLLPQVAYAQVFVPAPPEPPPAPAASLKTLAVPVPSELDRYVKDRAAAIALGKALFWDMQVGSDGVTACASCHFHAGADNRATGQVNPGTAAGDTVFTNGPNWTAGLPSFPFRVLADMEVATSTVVQDTNDVLSSQGVVRSTFSAVRPGYAKEHVLIAADPVFSQGGVPLRQVPPRNSPSVINAVFNLHNFWDGRANETFNGETPFGSADTGAGIFIDEGAGLSKQRLEMRNASLASQAVAPLVSDVEMRAIGRSRADLGKKLLAVRPLARQFVHPGDSVLGGRSRARIAPDGTMAGQRGLRTWYPEMIRAAFHERVWASTGIVRMTGSATPTVEPAPARPLRADEYTHMEANFPFIFGVAVMLYESTLISNDAPFDRWREGDAGALTPQQRLGFQVFSDLNRGRCVFCHGGPEFTNATHRGVAVDGRVELMGMLDPGNAFYDTGYYNIGVRPQDDDTGRGGVAPFVNSKTGQPIPLSDAKRGLLKRAGLLPPELESTTPTTQAGNGFPDPERTDVHGAFKTPSLRNVELTGPYMHSGGFATLKQVVEFYDRGGDFTQTTNFHNAPPLMTPLALTPDEVDAVVAFMLALTDERVRQERAPFDHPQLFLPDGRVESFGIIDLAAAGRTPGAGGFEPGTRIVELPAVGSGGRPAAGLQPLQPFLGLDPFQP